MLTVILTHTATLFKTREGAAVYYNVHLDSMEEERSMHCFSDDLHPSKGERQVGQTSAYPGTWQGFLAKKQKGVIEKTEKVTTV